MLSGEINVIEAMREAVERSNSRKAWQARQRRLVEWICWTEWCGCVHEEEKQAVERKWGQILTDVLAKRLRVYKRLQAYRKALAKARTHQERCQAVELLEEGQA